MEPRGKMETGDGKDGDWKPETGERKNREEKMTEIIFKFEDSNV
jgi:hypothetical protein